MHTALHLLEIAAIAHPVASALGFVLLRSTSVLWPPLPGLPMDLLGIRLFGALPAFVLAEAGIMFGATCAFFVGRYARDAARSSSFLERFATIAQTKWPLDGAEEKTAFQRWFIVRLLTNPLFDPLSYVGGLIPGRFGAFFWGTLLGNVPSMTLFYYILRQSDIGDPGRILLAASVFVIAVCYITNIWMSGLKCGTRS